MTDGLSGQTTSYGHDGLGRLVQAQSPSSSYQYAYDANRNRTSQTVNTQNSSPRVLSSRCSAPPPQPATVRGFIALGSSGRSDVSERAEEILRADFGA